MKLSKEQSAIVTKIFREGGSDDEIAAALTEAGRPMKTRRAEAARHELGLLRTHGGWNGRDQMDVEYVVEQFKTANPQTREEIARVIAGIAQDVGRHPGSVRRVLRQRKILALAIQEIDPEVLARAEALLREGVPYPEVVKETKISRDRLIRRFPGYAMSQSDAAYYRQAKRLAEKVGV
jgi:hypothetical protein